MEKETGHYSTFVIRIWSDESGGKLVGHIQHIASQDKGSFNSVEGMNEFVLEHLGSNSGWHSGATVLISEGGNVSACDLD